MFRGDRLFLLALAGLALLGITFGLGVMIGTSEQAQKYRYQSYRYAGDKPQDADSTLAGQASAQALGYRTPCDQQKGQGESELCAQWKAALAAEDSAAWANWALWVSAIGIAALVWQIGLTRRAMQDTGLALDIARRTADVAHDGHKAFVASERGHLQIAGFSLEMRGEQMDLMIHLENAGKGVCLVDGSSSRTAVDGIPENADTAAAGYQVKIAPGIVSSFTVATLKGEALPISVAGHFRYETLGITDRRTYFHCRVADVGRAGFGPHYEAKAAHPMWQPSDT